MNSTTTQPKRVDELLPSKTPSEGSVDISAQLKAPFANVLQRKGPGGKMLSYVTARQVMDRLDSVLGPDGWQATYHTVAGNVCCELKVNYGGTWITKSDGAGETSIEGEKGQFSDALKRAAVHHGIARYLYPDAEQPKRAEPTRVVAANESGAPWTDAMREASQHIKDAVAQDNPFQFYENWDEWNNDEKTTIFGDMDNYESKKIRQWQKDRKVENE